MYGEHKVSQITVSYEHLNKSHHNPGFKISQTYTQQNYYIIMDHFCPS